MKDCKEYEEYMTSLTEQVHDVRAKRLVEAELGCHIEEQAECYEGEGMSHRDAIKEAVRQMGNPVETGIELNKIHRPKMPWMMLAVIVVLMLVSIVMQAVIFLEGGNTTSGLGMLPKTIIYNIAGFCIILGLLYCDYNFIAKYAYVLYGVYVGGMPLFLLMVNGLGGHVTASTAFYGIQMLFPIIFAGVVYRNRNRGWRGAAICLIMGIVGIIWSGAVLGARGNMYRYSALVESLLIVGGILLVAFWKNVFRIEKRKSGFPVLAVIGAVTAGGILFLNFVGGGMQQYLWKRLGNAFSGQELSYMNLKLRESIAGAEWIGGQIFLLGEPNSESYGLFLLNSIFTYFGKLAGVLVIAAYIGFLIMALRMSLKQSNRIGMLVGTACTLSILVRFVAYVACNFGVGIWSTTLVPFLSYGRVSAVMNGIYVGLILCVYRNSRILAEEMIEQKPMKRIRIVVE